MIPLAPLWADLGDWAKIIPVLVIVAFWVLKHFFGGEEMQQKPRVRRPEPLRPPKPVAAPAERKRIDDEVGDFLRRAAQQRVAAQQQPAERRQPAELRPGVAQARPSPRTLVQRTVEARPVEVEAVEVEVLEEVQTGRSVEAHVKPRLGGRSLAQRLPKGEEVEHAVQAMQSHLHETFDHKVGHLAAARTATTDAAAEAQSQQGDAELAAADRLRALLSSPQGMRQAIVLGEVLRRPEERW